MTTVLEFSIPGGVLLLVAYGMFELHRQKVRKQPGTPVTATYVNEFTAIFYGSKRAELDERDTWSMWREEDPDAAPPAMGVDLDAGTVVLRPSDPTQS